MTKLRRGSREHICQRGEWWSALPFLGLSFYAQCKQARAASGTKPQTQSRPVTLTANIFLKHCWPTATWHVTFEVHRRGPLSRLCLEQWLHWPKWNEGKKKKKEEKKNSRSGAASYAGYYICSPGLCTYSALTSIFCTTGWPDRGARRARRHPFESSRHQYCPGQSNSPLGTQCSHLDWHFRKRDIGSSSTLQCKTDRLNLHY